MHTKYENIYVVYIYIYIYIYIHTYIHTYICMKYTREKASTYCNSSESSSSILFCGRLGGARL
jgi:hypothetical protein